jgi:hypothetical protein
MMTSTTIFPDSKPMWQEILLSAFCGLCVLVALGVAGWAIVSGQIAEQGLDGIFLLLVCLLIGLAFSAIPLQTVRKRLRERSGPRKTEPPAEADKTEGSA